MNFVMKCYSQSGAIENIPLGFSSDVKEVSGTAFSIVARVFLNRLRQATASTKTRGEVNYSRKKMWRQKGTGRARCGAAGSPLWRGGGVTFGPQSGCRRLSVNKKIRQGSLAFLVANRISGGQIGVLDFGFDSFAKGMTNKTSAFLRKVGIDKKRVGVVLSSDDLVNCRAFCNISGVDIFFFDQLNVKNLSSGNALYFLKKDLDQFKEVVAQWI